jgi:uncharacterized protein
MRGPILSRRQLLFGGGAAASIAALAGLCIEPRWLRIPEHDVPVTGLPKLLDGYRIAHITDAHLKHIGRVEEAIVREIENRNVQLVVLTGDIIDNPARINVLEEFCRNLQGKRRTILATMGNWEHGGRISLDELRDTYRAQNIRLMINESELFDSAIRVAAADDSSRGNVRLDKTMKRIPAAVVNLFLTHSPALLDQIPATVGAFDLALAGHTHGGQCRIGSFAPVRPPGSGRFISGWYNIPIGRAYVSCGTGTSVIPIRIACRPELPIFTLRQG